MVRIKEKRSDFPVSEAALIGLGRMGLPLGERMRDIGLRVVGFDLDKERRNKFVGAGLEVVDSASLACRSLTAPRLVLLLVPAGAAVDQALTELLTDLEPGDTILECGNSDYRDSRRRHALVGESDVRFLDVGVSGGISGARNGPCLTVGGEEAVYRELEPFLGELAREGGCSLVGPAGWGHLVKTVHNGIEYGFLQALAEGLQVIRAISGKEQAGVDLERLCRTWSSGSIIESRLLSDAIAALPLLAGSEISGRIGGGETGAWAADLAARAGVETPVLAAALDVRRRSQRELTEVGRIIAAIRYVFGQHDLSGE